MTGRKLAHYEIGERLGKGGMGEVFSAHDTKLGRDVALKVLPPEWAGDETRRARFEREARTVAGLNHPNIVTLHSVEEHEGIHFITMELVQGLPLSSRIRGTGLSPEQFLEIAIPLADAISAAHQEGVTHRDIKPDNVMVDERGRVKVLDFGLAKLREASPGARAQMPTATVTAEGRIVGTVAYMSPEQAEGKTVDARSDIFSLGIVLYEMATGRNPFSGDTSVSIISSIMKDTPSSVTDVDPSLPRQLARIIGHCLEKDPERRFQTALDLRNELEQLRKEMETGETARPPADARTRSTRIWPWVAGLGLVALVVLVVALVRGFPGEGDAAESVAAPGIGASGRPAIAVLHFEDHTGAEEIRWLSTGLPSMLLTGLAQTPGLDVVSGQRIAEILAEVGQQNVESIDRSILAEVGRRSGAGAVVVGSIFKSGEEIRIDVQVEDVATGRLLAANTVTGTDVFPLVDELTDGIRDSLRIGAIPETRGIAEITTESLDAYRLYNEGMEANRNLRWRDAKEALEQAVAIDPEFTMAYFGLVEVHNRWNDMPAVERYSREVEAGLDRLSERQRLHVLATFALIRDGDLHQALDLFEKLIARYPDEEDAHLRLVSIHRQLEQTDDALEALERAVETIPRSGEIRNTYGYQLLDVGRYPEAIEQLETYAELNPREPNPWDSLGEAYLITGQPEKAIERFERALEIDPGFFQGMDGIAWACAMAGDYDGAFEQRAKIRPMVLDMELPVAVGQFLSGWAYSRVGRYREADEEIRQGLEQTAEGDQALMETAIALLSATVRLERGDRGRALEMVERAIALAPKISHPVAKPGSQLLGGLIAGMAEVRAGNVDAAREWLEVQRRLEPQSAPMFNWAHQTLRAEIALVEGDLDTAGAAFAAAEPRFKMFFSRSEVAPTMFANNLALRDGPARLRVALGDPDGAIEIYRELLTPDIGSKYTSWLEPRFVLELARLLDRTGDREGAAEEYRRFLDLWKDADADLPELDEARRRLAP